MQLGATFIIISLGFAAGAQAQPTGPGAESNGPLRGLAVRGHILELVKQDALRVRVETKSESVRAVDQVLNTLPVAEGVVQLEPFIVTEKKPIILPPRLRPTLDNFFNGDGTIAESKSGRVSLSAGPEGKLGLVGIKLNFKF